MPAVVNAKITVFRAAPFTAAGLRGNVMGSGFFRLPRLFGRPAPRQRVVCALLAALMLAPAPAMAQNSDSATAQTQVAVLAPGSIEKLDDMNFGTIAQPFGGGTVVIAPSGTPGCAVTNGLVHSGGCRAARFAIRGKRNERVRIREVNNGVVTLNGPGTAKMTVTNLTIGISPSMSTAPGGNGWNLGNYRIDAPSGLTDFYLGGTLNVAAAQRPGVYTGTILIQIQFN